MDPATTPHALMAPLGTRPVVVDTSALINDVLRRCRQDGPTALLEAADQHSARIFAAGHVAGEVARILPSVVAARGIEPAIARSTWDTAYAPAVWFVQVPSQMLSESSLAALAMRDESDVPTAVLAQLIDAAVVLTEDRDLLDTGFGAHHWLEATLALRQIGRYQSGVVSVAVGANLAVLGLGATIDGAVRHPWRATIVVASALAAAFVAARRGWLPTRAGVRAVLREASDLLIQAQKGYVNATATMTAVKPFPGGSQVSEAHAVVRALARANAPMSVRALVEATGLPSKLVEEQLAAADVTRGVAGSVLGWLQADRR